jgi:hypothetical protein
VQIALDQQATIVCHGKATVGANQAGLEFFPRFPDPFLEVLQFRTTKFRIPLPYQDPPPVFDGLLIWWRGTTDRFGVISIWAGNVRFRSMLSKKA